MVLLSSDQGLRKDALLELTASGTPLGFINILRKATLENEQKRYTSISAMVEEIQRFSRTEALRIVVQEVAEESEERTLPKIKLDEDPDLRDSDHSTENGDFPDG